ncbi:MULTISPECIES: DUF1826 domain-containing protein [unclassified Agarivorans]|uniref:DUF1826 domain-containing protein n=1 Tax=unclassified Agarivorans TaxID=2636026 RepID=UPI003D7C9075
MNAQISDTLTSKANTPEVLTEIYDSKRELTVWLRDTDSDILDYAQTLVASHSMFRGITARLSVGEVSDYMSQKLPAGPGRAALIEDLVLICDMFSCLFELEHIGLRLVKLEQSMCPKFHCDQVPCRLLVSYLGAGTEYRDLASRNGSSSPTEAPAVHNIPLFAVALLKGQGWEDDSEHGLFHRSPTSNELYPRLLLSLDFAS